MKPSLVSFKKFRVLPSGHISGGEVSYSLDPVQGTLVWSAHIPLNIWGVNVYTLDMQNQILKLDPEQLLCSSFKVGQKIAIGPVAIEVVSLAGGKGVAKITVQDGDVNEVGTADFDMSGLYVSLLDLASNGQVKGYDVNLTLEPEA